MSSSAGSGRAPFVRPQRSEAANQRDPECSGEGAESSGQDGETEGEAAQEGPRAAQELTSTTGGAGLESRQEMSWESLLVSDRTFTAALGDRLKRGSSDWTLALCSSGSPYTLPDPAPCEGGGACVQT